MGFTFTMYYMSTHMYMSNRCVKFKWDKIRLRDRIDLKYQVGSTYKCCIFGECSNRSSLSVSKLLLLKSLKHKKKQNKLYGDNWLGEVDW